MPTNQSLIDFLMESNRIESIFHVKPGEIVAAEALLQLPKLAIDDVSKYVQATAPHAELRAAKGMDVQVGAFFPPPGGPGIPIMLDNLLGEINDRKINAFRAHIRYETIHPYMDGNGRSGRLVWLWQIKREGGTGLGFLHHWYYSSLQAAR